MRPILACSGRLSAVLLFGLICACGSEDTSAGRRDPGRTSSGTISRTAPPVAKRSPTKPAESQGFIDSEDPAVIKFRRVPKPFWTPPAFTGDGCEGDTGMWGEVVQKALWFLNVNRSGPGLTHTFVQWRGDSHLDDARIVLSADDPNGVNMSQEYIERWRTVLDPDGDNELDMAGGFYDAGDFLKIGITSNYMAHTLAWTLIVFPEAFDQTGMRPEALSLLRAYADFALKNTYIENPEDPNPWNWNVVAYGHQVGGASDHDCGWMPPELRRAKSCPRKGYFSTHENPSADITAGAAAALALTGWLLRGEDPDYATRALNHAIALYEFAKKYHGTTWDTDGLYQSESSYDDLAWAAVWLHELLPDAGQPGADERTALYASHRAGYLDDVLGDSEKSGHEPWFNMFRNGAGPKIDTCKQDSSGTCWEESWTHIWNSLRSGVFLKLAEILERTGNRYGALRPGVKAIARRDSLAWVTGPHSPGGFAKKVDVSWGSGRYNSAGQMVALIYARAFPDDVIPQSAGAALAGKNTADVLVDWAKGQSEYLLGKNPLNQSYMMGYSDNFADHAHHAATHASIYGLCDDPIESKHVAYGALVSGPNAGDEHSDNRCDYGANEITIDYNAAFIGALAGNYVTQGLGQCPDPNFPPVEPPFDEFYTKARINDDSPCWSQVEITLVNETAHPPRFDTTVKYRYYIDVSELQAKGFDPSEITGKVIHDNYGEEPAIISEMKPCTLNTSTYYFEVSYPYEFWGAQVWLKGPRVAILEIGVENTSTCTYEMANDWSAASLTRDVEFSPAIPAYAQGELVWGAEPECDEPPKIAVNPPTVR